MARLEVHQMNTETQKQKESVSSFDRGPPRPVRAQTAMVTAGSGGTTFGGYGQLREQHQSRVYYDTSQPQSAAATAMHIVGTGHDFQRQEGQLQEEQLHQFQKHKEKLSRLGNLSHGEPPPPQDQSVSEQSWHRSQSAERFTPTTHPVLKASATVNLGSPAEIARQA